AAGLLEPPTILAACGGDQELLDEIVQVYRRRAPALLDGVRDAVTRRDAAALTRAAHACKGIVATFSAVAGSAARKLEEMGRFGELDGAEVACGELADLVARLDGELSGIRVERLR